DAKPGAPAATPVAPATALLAPLQQYKLVISVEAAPRVLLALRTRPHDPGQPGLDLGLSSEDHDADEHADVRAELTLLVAEGSEPVHMQLWWLNRPSGLARDTSEPEQTLATLADQAQRALGGKPAGALPFAERALAIQRALCRERVAT